MEFDDILKNYLGEFGVYQILFILFASSIAINDVMNDLDYTFTAATPRFWCVDADLSHLQTENFTRLELTHLLSPLQKDKTGIYDHCQLYDRNYSSMSYEEATSLVGVTNTTGATRKCTKWEYSKEEFTSTIVTEWDLVCDKEWLVATSQAIYMAGRFTVIIGGTLADRFGRRHVAVAMLILHVLSRIAVGLAVNYYMFVAARFVQSVCSVNWYSAIFVIGLEMVGPKWRIFAGQSVSFFYALGYILLAGMAYLVRDWRNLSLILLVFAVPFVFHICFLPESVRWLISKNKMKDAKRIMKQMAKINRKELPSDYTLNNQISSDSILGRKFTTSFSFILSGISFLALVFVPSGMTWLIITLALTGKFSISITFSLIYIYTSELFPTDLRGSGLSFCSTWSRFGGIIGPYIVLMANVTPYLPPLLLGTLGMLSGIAALFLPETRGQSLPETVTQVQQFKTHNKESEVSEESDLKTAETLPLQANGNASVKV